MKLSPIQKSNTGAHKGQVLPLALAVLVLACVTFFVVFNSGRALNEKINLVNAADASAYSGAQVAARHLNFMAYTNRAMIANEVAIGHLYSFQVEVELLGKVTQDTVSGITGNSLLGQLGRLILTAINPDLPNYVEYINQVIQPLVDSSKVFTGMLSLMLDANNATFSNFQEQAYLDLIQADPNTNQTVVDRAMAVVANSYIERAAAPIRLNREVSTLSDFLTSENTPVASAAQMANEGATQELCEMILFATPGAQVANPLGSEFGARSQNCAQVVNGTADLSIGIAGTPLSPEADGGVMIETLSQSVVQMENATWIRDRNVDNYSLLGLFRADREGSTRVEYNQAAGNMNWVADSDSYSVRLAGLQIYRTTVDENVDAAQNVEQATTLVDDLAIRGLQLFGLCGDNSAIDCNLLAQNSYDSMQRYAALDPNRQRATVTAFLEQANCSDNIGRNEDGVLLEGWRDNLETTGESFCGNKNVYAIGQAEVYFQRPDCYEDGNTTCARSGNGFSRLGNGAVETPNLYNPFWHARLVATGR